MNLTSLLSSKYLYWIIGAYVVGAVIVGLELHLHGCSMPILRSLLWPVPLVRFLCGANL
jgi:hypothetical protein